MEYFSVFLTGAAGYSLIEVAWRGYTHWTMSLTGGMCLLLIYIVNAKYPETSIWAKCFLGAAIITSAEFAVGTVVNVVLKWNVWDYSGIPFNLLGQICLPYMVLWYFLCFPVTAVCKKLLSIFHGI